MWFELDLYSLLKLLYHNRYVINILILKTFPLIKNKQYSRSGNSQRFIRFYQVLSFQLAWTEVQEDFLLSRWRGRGHWHECRLRSRETFCFHFWLKFSKLQYIYCCLTVILNTWSDVSYGVMV